MVISKQSIKLGFLSRYYTIFSTKLVYWFDFDVSFGNSFLAYAPAY